MDQQTVNPVLCWASQCNSHSSSFKPMNIQWRAEVANSFNSRCTRWFKYDRAYLCVNKSQFVPVISEPPCTNTTARNHEPTTGFGHSALHMSTLSMWRSHACLKRQSCPTFLCLPTCFFLCRADSHKIWTEASTNPAHVYDKSIIQKW